jgi:glycosyltransferase involved in cell wall biosynthesis
MFSPLSAAHLAQSEPTEVHLEAFLSENIESKRVAIVHDWLTGMRGGEKCLEPLCRRWPQAKLFTLLHAKGAMSPTIEAMDIRTSFLQRVPSIEKRYRYFLPLMPVAARWPIRDVDLVVSLNHAVAKSAKAPAGVPHVSYCFTPMRYAWHMKDSYFGDRVKGLKARALDAFMGRMREWDRKTASRVTHFVAISETIRERIRECYGRESHVINPPVDTDFYTPDPTVKREDYYLVLSAFAPYKRFDLALEACNRTGKRLVVIGTGQDAARLKAMAGPNVEFLGWASDETIRDHLRRCRALLFPGLEDFGIVPVEANACGAPVIAFGQGGASETIVPLDKPNPTGVWFMEQNADALIAAMEQCERATFDPNAARKQSERFSKQIFESRLFGYLDEVTRIAPKN